jgi:hypothetical protein
LDSKKTYAKQREPLFDPKRVYAKMRRPIFESE